MRRRRRNTRSEYITGERKRRARVEKMKGGGYSA